MYKKSANYLISITYFTLLYSDIMCTCQTVLTTRYIKKRQVRQAALKVK